MTSTIAIVDDDPIYSGSLKEFFEMRGHKVWRALDLAQFEIFIKDNKEMRPDLIVCDMQMPAGGGPGAARMLKGDENLKNIPIIFVSAMPVDKMKEWFAHLDQNTLRYLHKPPDFELLDQYLKEFLPGKI